VAGAHCVSASFVAALLACALVATDVRAEEMGDDLPAAVEFTGEASDELGTQPVRGESAGSDERADHDRAELERTEHERAVLMDPRERDAHIRIPHTLIPASSFVYDAELMGYVTWDAAEERWDLVLHVDGCRIVESEPSLRHGDGDPSDCAAGVRTWLDARVHRPLMARPGRYRVVVRNLSTRGDAGIWVRRAESGETIMSAGGVPPGEERAMMMTLERGTYLVSCPLHLTPDYLWLVQ